MLFELFRPDVHPVRGLAIGPPYRIPGVYPVDDATLEIYGAGSLRAKLCTAVPDRAIGDHGRVLDPMALFPKLLLADGVYIDDRDGSLGVIPAINPEHGRLEAVCIGWRDDGDI